jgi:hypothetical protein
MSQGAAYIVPFTVPVGLITQAVNTGFAVGPWYPGVDEVGKPVGVQLHADCEKALPKAAKTLHSTIKTINNFFITFSFFVLSRKY